MESTQTPFMDRFRLDGKVAVVTGSGRGIGRRIATGLAEAGADVVVTARREADVAAVAAEIRSIGRRSLALPGDITDDTFVESLVTTAVSELGRVDIWVSNAGGSDNPVRRPVVDVPDKQWEHLFDLNLRAVFAGARAVAPVLSDGGSIINLSSMAADKAAPNNAAYAAAKAGVNSLTMSLSSELADRRIRVNAIAPGPVPTDVFMDFFKATEDDLPRIAGEMNIPLGRLGTPDDMAAAIVFLASPAASWITGQVLHVDGGHRP